ncbi:MAG: hypothetical protein GY710_17420 [Desulfobacteraceae bacterium]|nr:hypothetical protein [Desulfobacteraceae bacterium]
MKDIIIKTILFFCIPVICGLFSWGCSQQPLENNQQEIQLKYCTILYQFVENENYLLKISLKSNCDYTINGDKYPPIKLSLSANEHLKIDPLNLTAKKLDKNNSVSWYVRIAKQSYTEQEKIDACLDTIICVNNTCIMEKNPIQLKLNF